MKRLFVLISIIFILKQHNTTFCQQIAVLNLMPAIDHPVNIKLSDFVESITYIPLATNYDCLVDNNPKVFVTKEYIITVTLLKCLVFNRKNGEFIREIGRYGRGPGEYQSTKGFINDQIPVCYFNGWGGRLIKYTIEGVFVGSFNIPGYKDSFDEPNLPMNYSFINDSIIVCDLLIARGTETNSLMIFNENGKIVSTIPNRNILEAKRNFVLRTGEATFYRFNNMVFFQSLYNDTIFKVSSEKITPYLILNRGKHSPPFESKWWSFEKQLQANFISLPQYFESKRYISFNFYLSKIRYFALYDKSSKVLKVVDVSSGIKNDIDGFMNFSFDSMNSEGDLIGIIQSNNVVHWIQKNPENFKLMNPELQKLLNVELEDNPVIVIAKYRQ